MILNVDIPFDFFKIVYLVTDKDQLPRMVTGVKSCPYGDVLIELTSGTTTGFHYLGEISETKDVSMATTN